MKVVLAESVEIKLSNIYRYLSEQAGDGIASKHILDIENTILSKLDGFPKIGEPYQSELLRKVVVKVGKATRYTVLYEINEEQNIVSVYQIYGKGENW